MSKKSKKDWEDADLADEEYDDEYEHVNYKTNRGHYNTVKPEGRASIKRQLDNEFKKYINN